MATYLHVSFNFEGRPPPTEKLNELFNTALDWISYAPNCWILWTTSTPEVWHSYLKKVVDPGDSIFIVEIKVENRGGFLPSAIWQWLQKSR